MWLVVFGMLATLLVFPQPFDPVAEAFPGGVNGARLWLRADESVTATSGGAVLVWGDVSGSPTVTREATTQSGGVTLVSSAVNFNPTVHFAGGSQHYMAGDTSQNFSTAATIFVVSTPRPKATSLQGLVQTGHQGIFYNGNADQAIVEGIEADQSNSANTVDPLADRWTILRGSYTNGGSTSGTSIAVQGRLNENFTGFGADLDAVSNFEIGRTPGNPSDRTFGGDIAETLYFPRVLTAAESNRVESYLALKYGVTLNGPTTLGTPADYTSSTPTVIWSGVANPTYHNDVAGIGRDGPNPDPDLDQRVSNSTNPGPQPAIANGNYDFSGTPTAQSPATQPASGSFLTWGHDGGTIPIAQSITGATAAANGINTRMGRVWRTQLTNDTGLGAQLSIRIPAVMLDVTPELTNPSLLISTDPNFADITRSVALTRDGLFYRATFDRFATGEFFTFGGALPVISQVPVCANPPVSGTTSISGIVNTYFEGQSASVPANQGNTTINVGSGRGAAPPLAVGDMVLVVQMQGADIDATNTPNYGGHDGTGRGYLSAGRTAGNYEFAAVTAVAGSLVTVRGGGSNGGLINSYTKAARTTTRGVSSYQVIRVPQYYNATMTGTVTAIPWDGISGGIVALDVAGTLNFNGRVIEVSNMGFRGGAGRSVSSASGSFFAIDYRRPNGTRRGGQKGEGIVGTRNSSFGTDGYPEGDLDRGAPGNAGGGANGVQFDGSSDAGGGGGGGFDAGGTGGDAHPFSDSRPVGGIGGGGVDDLNLLTLGGGGGAGAANDGGTPSGRDGGGIVFIRAGAASGVGSIRANGEEGESSGGGGPFEGAGGGGGGGRVILLSRAGSLTGVTVSAVGGAGGDAPTDHGPGGGGWRRRDLSQQCAQRSELGRGRRRRPGWRLRPRGARPGLAGAINTSQPPSSATGIASGSFCADLVVTKTIAAGSSTVPGGTARYTITVTNRGPFPSTGTAPFHLADTVPAPLTNVTWTCSATVGSTCGATSGSGNTIDTTANLAASGVATYSVTATIPPSATGSISNVGHRGPGYEWGGALQHGRRQCHGGDRSDAAGRHLGDEDRWGDLGRARQPDDVHDDREQRRAVVGVRRARDRCAAGRRRQRNVDMHGRRGRDVHDGERDVPDRHDGRLRGRDAGRTGHLLGDAADESHRGGLAHQHGERGRAGGCDRPELRQQPGRRRRRAHTAIRRVGDEVQWTGVDRRRRVAHVHDHRPFRRAVGDQRRWRSMTTRRPDSPRRPGRARLHPVRPARRDRARTASTPRST